MYEMEGPRSAVRPAPADCSANTSRMARHRSRAPAPSSGDPALEDFPGLPPFGARNRWPTSSGNPA
jgi:hypothetical protein